MSESMRSYFYNCVCVCVRMCVCVSIYIDIGACLSDVVTLFNKKIKK